MTHKLIMLVGIPGSGKSTWARNQVEKWQDRGYTAKIISLDDIRFSMIGDGDDYFRYENAVFAAFIKAINDAMNEGINLVVVDATHISPASRFKVLSRLHPPHPETMSLELAVFATSLETCIERNDMRTGLAKVPVSAIKSMAKGFTPPTMEELNNPKFPPFRGHIIFEKGEF